jgi:hypothetical protein
MSQDIKSAAAAVPSKPTPSGIMLLGALSLCALLAGIRVAQASHPFPI